MQLIPGAVCVVQREYLFACFLRKVDGWMDGWEGNPVRVHFHDGHGHGYVLMRGRWRRRGGFWQMGTFTVDVRAGGGWA